MKNELATHSVEGSSAPKVAYLSKVYPRFSQTFVLNEILAHQAADCPVEIFSLRRPNDGRFHAALSTVDSPVRYFDELPTDADTFLEQARKADGELPSLWETLRREPEASADNLYQAINVALAIQSCGIQHIHAHFGNVATTVARLAAAMSGITYSFTAHARDIFHDNVCDHDLSRKIQDAAGVVTVSQFNVDHLHENLEVPADRIRLVYNGMDLKAFPFAASSGSVPTVVAVGRLIEKKGFGVLIDAVEILVRNGFPDLRCTIVGAGPLANELQAKIVRHNLEQNVLLTRALPSDQVKRLICEATVFAAPCVVAADGDRDGLPTVLLEAMALGTPCVATPVTGIPEAIAHEQTGLLVSQNDPDGLAQACRRLLADRDLRTQLAKNARKLIEERFDVSKSCHALRQLFETCIVENTAAVKGQMS